MWPPGSPRGTFRTPDVRHPHRFREAELKHGRVAMLASAGMITADKFHPLFDGKLSSNPLLAISQVCAQHPLLYARPLPSPVPDRFARVCPTLNCYLRLRCLGRAPEVQAADATIARAGAEAGPPPDFCLHWLL